MDASLRDGNAVERGVELGVAAAVESVALVLAGAGVGRTRDQFKLNGGVEDLCALFLGWIPVRVGD